MFRTTHFTIGFALLSVFAFAAPVAAAAEVQFDKLRHDFGDIGHYDKPEVVFTFTNTGDTPVKIKIVRSSNQVGRPTAPEDPVAPGESAEILVKARTRYGGPFRVHLDVVEETDGSIATLVMTGNVLAKEDSIKP